LLEGFCPNCGTPIEIADSTECPSCKALVNSGDYDWVLAEITQESEWQFQPPKNIPGLEELRKNDPAFSIQHVEDRCSVMFYRHIAAGFFADSRYIRKLACDDFVKANDSYQPLPDGRHRFFADAAVGAVEVVEIKNTDTMDNIRVKVKWSGHREDKKIPSLIKPDFDASHLYTHEFILMRDHGVESSSQNVLTSTHCPNCGAPETLSDKECCEYCQTPLNDGRRDWVLADMRPFSGYPRAQTVSHFESSADSLLTASGGPTLSTVDNESILACAAGLMLADGHIDDKEMALLTDMSTAKGVSEKKLQQIINSVSQGTLEVPQPESPEVAQEFLRSMVLMCLVDGKVSSAERVLLKQLVSNMGYSDIDIDQMIKKERNSLYIQAKKIKLS
jgi:uncharacterized tellurite resistance protein B-like protein/predicted nucleic acid-binding Zn ribbon protein